LADDHDTEAVTASCSNRLFINEDDKTDSELPTIHDEDHDDDDMDTAASIPQ
jgi:hypothetical protein